MAAAIVRAAWLSWQHKVDELPGHASLSVAAWKGQIPLLQIIMIIQIFMPLAQGADPLPQQDSLILPHTTLIPEMQDSRVKEPLLKS